MRKRSYFLIGNSLLAAFVCGFTISTGSKAQSVPPPTRCDAPSAAQEPAPAQPPHPKFVFGSMIWAPVAPGSSQYHWCDPSKSKDCVE